MFSTMILQEIERIPRVDPLKEGGNRRGIVVLLDLRTG